MHKADTVEKDTLEFIKAQLTKEDLCAIAAHIEKNHRLDHLNFAGCNLSADDFLVISTSIMNSKHIEFLGLHNNDICNTAEGVQTLIQILQTNTSIERLVLSKNNLTTAIISELIPILINNKTIHNVSFASNQLEKEAFVLLEPLITKPGGCLISITSLIDTNLSPDDENRYEQLIEHHTVMRYNPNQNAAPKQRCVLF